MDNQFTPGQHLGKEKAQSTVSELTKMMASTFTLSCTNFKKFQRNIISLVGWVFEDDYAGEYLRQVDTATAENLTQFPMNLKMFDSALKNNVKSKSPPQCVEALANFESVPDIKTGER